MNIRHLFFIALSSPFAAIAQDTSLHDWLIPGEDWKPAVTGQTFTDGLCVDKEGNLFYTDVRNGKGIYKLDATTGQTSLVIDNLPGISGVQIGPDGRFYACHNREQRVIAIDKAGQIDVFLTGVKCNDLVVTTAGNLYFTETPTKRVHLIKKDKSHVIADEGHVTRPNGISVSPDQKTLAVSDHGGQNVWTWQINDDGTLAGGAPYMTMELPLEPNQAGNAKPGERPANLPLFKKEALGDGMTTETSGRWFVTTALGVQVFDQAGRLAGTLARPKPDSKVVSVEFAGKDHDILYIAAGDTIWGRRLKVKGWFGTGQ
ncbi:MAG: SMP-30/gluconolactonase/LRE family protein [Verrucomicrobiaceae bacterium]|nr:SMP-30/gluconolactonase/LRE family protein [Verrucomicrobiaceae bacterium]